MKKEISVSGVNGKFIGEVEILFDFRKGPHTFHNRGTHEEKTKVIGWHKVIGRYEGKEVASSEEFLGRDNAMNHAPLVEKTLHKYLETLANSKWVSVEDKLKKNGYK
jgi:hypothetical protein